MRIGISLAVLFALTACSSAQAAPRVCSPDGLTRVIVQSSWAERESILVEAHQTGASLAAPLLDLSMTASTTRLGPQLEVAFGPQVWKELAGRTVIDFGCADGIESIDMAQHGVGRIIGIDIRKSALEIARKRATDAGLEDRCNLPLRFMGRLMLPSVSTPSSTSVIH